jgi:hypothetical protein
MEKNIRARDIMTKKVNLRTLSLTYYIAGHYFLGLTDVKSTFRPLKMPFRFLWRLAAQQMAYCTSLL